MISSEKNQRGPDFRGRRRDQLPAARGGRRLTRMRVVVRFQMLVRVLDHHDRRVDHRADRDRDPAERHQVRIHALVTHHDERGQYAERQRQDRDERAAQMEQEHRADDPDDDEFLDQLVLQVADRALDQLRSVVGRDDVDAGRQRTLQAGELRLHRVDRRQGVLARAHHDDAARHFALPVQLGDPAPHRRADLDVRDVAEQHRRARVVGTQHDAAEVVERAQVAGRTHHVLRLGQLDDRAAGCLVGLAERIRDRRLRDAVGTQLVGIEDDLVLAHHAADARDFRDVRHGLQLELQEPVVERAQLPEIVTAGAIDERVLVHPADAGRIRPERHGRAGRQAALHLAQVFEHARARPVGIGAVVEQHVDERIAERRVRAHGRRARHAEQRRRQRIGDLILDDLRRLARIRRLHDHLRVRQVGQRIERRLPQRMNTPSGDQHGGQQHQEAIPDGPENDARDHRSPPCGSTFVSR